MMPLAFINNLGGPELLIIAFVALLVFGNRLPSVMRSLGKSVTEFKKGVSGIEDEIDNAAKTPVNGPAQDPVSTPTTTKVD